MELGRGNFLQRAGLFRKKTCARAFIYQSASVERWLFYGFSLGTNGECHLRHAREVCGTRSELNRLSTAHKKYQG